MVHAKTFKMNVPGVLRDTDKVVHNEKRMLVKGNAVWVKPHYTKTWKHKLPTGKSV